MKNILLPAWSGCTPGRPAAFLLVAVVSSAFVLTFLNPVRSDTDQVAHIVAHGPIDATMRHFIRDRMNSLSKRSPSLILLELQSTSGRIDYAFDLVDAFNQRSVPLAVYVSGRVAGPAALLCFASDHLFLNTNARINLNPAGPGNGTSSLFRKEYGPELASKFAGVAERNGYSTGIARAMVDPALILKRIRLNGKEYFATGGQIDRLRRRATPSVIETVNPSGQRLTLSSGDVSRFGISGKTVTSVEGVLNKLRDRGLIQSLQVFLHTMNGSIAYAVLRLLTGRLVVGLLIVLGTLSALVEIKRPGTGWSGAVAVLSFGLPAIGFAFLGLVRPTEMILLMLGLSLMALDTLLIPGEGVTGFCGLLPIVLSLVLARNSFLIPDWKASPWEVQYLFDEFSLVMLSLGIGIVAFCALLRLYSSLFDSVSLFWISTEQTENSQRFPSSEELIGKSGSVRQALRPVGIVDLDGVPVKVATDGFYLDPETTFTVVDVDGPRIRVRIG